jgi:tetratricopeptide (TPR) repeat protein
MSKNSFEQNFAEAKRAHQAGDRERAEFYYRKVLEQAPNDPQLLYLFGSLYYERHRFDEAKKLLQKSISLRSSYLPALAMLGAIHSALGEREAAVNCFSSVVRIAPNDVDAQFNLAKALSNAEHYQASLTYYRDVLAAKPQDGLALLGLTNSLEKLGQIDSAITEFESFLSRITRDPNIFLAFGALLLRSSDEKRAAVVFEGCLAHHPTNADALLQLGSSHFRAGRFGEAEILFRRLVALMPNNIVALNHLAATLTYLNLLNEAEVLSLRAYNLSPQNPETLVTFGLLLQEQGRSTEAEALFRQAVALRPTFAEGWNNIGMCLHSQGKTVDALEYYDRCITLKPDFPGAYTNKAQALMALGRLKEGWGIYHRRFDQKIYGAERRSFSLPLWDGVIVPDLKLLIWTDQGLGDELIYSSMVPDLQKKGVNIVLECSKRLVPLFKRSFTGAAVVPRSLPLDPAINELRPNAHISIAELGALLRPDLPSFPNGRGHLRADNALVDATRAEYKARAGGRPIIGLSWKSENPRTGKSKSIAVQDFAAMLRLCEADFVSLQYGDDFTDLQSLSAHGINLYKDPRINALADMDRFAAQVASMDLVITVSNTTAHIAGALNVPVWNMIPLGQGALWYWLINGDYSPWYSSMRLFRQQRSGEWNLPIRGVIKNLEHMVRAQ